MRATQYTHAHTRTHTCTHARTQRQCWSAFNTHTYVLVTRFSGFAGVSNDPSGMSWTSPVCSRALHMSLCAWDTMNDSRSGCGYEADGETFWQLLRDGGESLSVAYNIKRKGTLQSASFSFCSPSWSVVRLESPLRTPQMNKWSGSSSDQDPRRTSWNDRRCQLRLYLFIKLI